jgi:hypothetical protein
MEGGRRVKAPVPGEILRRVDSSEMFGTHLMFEGVLIHECEYPPPEWLASHQHIADAWNGFPRGWWYVLQGETPTYHLRYGTIYVFDGTRWRKQDWKHLAEENDGVEAPGDTSGENAFELESEEYLAEGEDP